MNIHLVNFYKTWLHWATHENASNPAGFAAKRGLCNELSGYCAWLGVDAPAFSDLLDEMILQFREHGLDPTAPFNEGLDNYWAETDKRKNPSRIQWCIDRIAEAENHD